MAGFNRITCRSGMVDLSVLDFGVPKGMPADACQSVLLLHGMRDHALGMLSIIHDLSERYRVVSFDLRGHGKSENNGVYPMIQFVADARAVVNQLDLVKPIVIGHSLGGHIASRYTAVYSDEVCKLVLLDGMGPPGGMMKSDVESNRQRMLMSLDICAASGLPSRSMANLDEAISRLRRNNPKLQPDMLQIIAKEGVEAHPQGGLQWNFDPAVQMIWSTFSTLDTEQLCGLIACPTLIVTGENSLDYWGQMNDSYLGQQVFYESELKRRLSLFPDAKGTVIPDAGHMLHYDQPEAVNLVLREFLG